MDTDESVGRRSKSDRGITSGTAGILFKARRPEVRNRQELYESSQECKEEHVVRDSPGNSDRVSERVSSREVGSGSTIQDEIKRNSDPSIERAGGGAQHEGMSGKSGDGKEWVAVKSDGGGAKCCGKREGEKDSGEEQEVLEAAKLCPALQPELLKVALKIFDLDNSGTVTREVSLLLSVIRLSDCVEQVSQVCCTILLGNSTGVISLEGLDRLPRAVFGVRRLDCGTVRS